MDLLFPVVVHTSYSPQVVSAWNVEVKLLIPAVFPTGPLAFLPNVFNGVATLETVLTIFFLVVVMRLYSSNEPIVGAYLVDVSIICIVVRPVTAVRLFGVAIAAKRPSAVFVVIAVNASKS